MGQRPLVVELDKATNEFQHLEVLQRNRTKRKQYAEVFLEGVACINAAIEAGEQVTSIAYDRERRLSRWAQRVIDDCRPEKVLRLSSELMAKLSDKTDPSELIVTLRMKPRALADIPLSERLLVVLFERPSNTGNLGTIIRTSEAFGADGVITTGHAVDIYDPLTLRASLGAFFRLPVVHCPSAGLLEAWIEDVRRELPRTRLVGAHPQSDKIVTAVDYTKPLIIVVGNETTGLGRRLEALSDELVIIPMSGHADSLNVACAATVMLYEVCRQRGFGVSPTA